MTLIQSVEIAEEGVTTLSRVDDYDMVQVEVIKGERLIQLDSECDYLTLEDLKADDWKVINFRRYSE